MKPFWAYGDMTPHEHIVLFRYCQIPGDHVDVGTLWGGSACTAAIAKSDDRYTVHTVDPDVRDNLQTIINCINVWRLRNEGTIANIAFHTAKHPEGWKATGDTFTTALIDGDHSYESCLADYEALKNVIKNYLIFHDNDLEGVQRVIELSKSEGWIPVRTCYKLTVLKRGNVHLRQSLPNRKKGERRNPGAGC